MRILALSVAFCCFANRAQGQQAAQQADQGAAQNTFTWSIGASGEYSDNYLRLENSPEGEAFYSAFVRFNGSGSGERWQITTAADLAYRTFPSDVIDNQLFGGFSGDAQYDVIKDYLQLFAGDNYGQTRSDASASDASTLDINVAYGGARLSAPLGARTSLFATGTLTKSSQESIPPAADFDTTRKDVTAGLRRALSDRSSVNLTAGRSRLEDDLFPSGYYDTDQASIGYEARFARTDIDLTVGKTRLVGEGLDQSGGLLLNANLVRRVGTRLQLQLSGGSQYSDSASTFVQQQQLGGVSQTPLTITQTSDPFKADNAFFGMSFSGARNDVAAHYSWRRERHEIVTTADAEFHLIDGVYTRTFSPNFDLGLSVGYERSRIESVAESVSTKYGRLVGDIRFARSFLVQIYAARFVGSAVFDYTENRYGISISYAPGQ